MATKYDFHENTFTTSAQHLTDVGPVTVAAGAYVLSASYGFQLDPGAWTVKIDGAVYGNYGLVLNGGPDTVTKNSHVTVGEEGTLVGIDGLNSTLGVGIYTLASTDITNAGLIAGGSEGIYVQNFGIIATKGFTITNSATGTIEGTYAILDDAGSAHLMTVKNLGTMRGDVDAIAWSGAAAITNSGTIVGDVAALPGATASAVTNSGEIDGSVTLAGDDSMLKNSGDIAGDIRYSDGGAMTNSGTIGGFVSMIGSGAGVVKNSGSIGGFVDLGDGGNSMTNSGTIHAALLGGSGVDIIKNTGAIQGYVDLADGNDVFTGGNNAETVYDNIGGDTYKLGGGDDYLAASFGSDAADGGAGIDTIALFADAVINLGSKVANLGGQTLQAALLHTASTDTAIKGFEIVRGSNGDDRIAGGTGKETLDGGAGNDFLAGGLGVDTLTGGTGNDTFVYFDIKDSGKTHATRDTITDFSGAGGAGGDVIDLSAIDADTKTTGNQAFSAPGHNTAFTGLAGELRIVYDGHDTIIQGDVNGDTKADFSIALVGNHSTIDAGDLIP